MDEWDELRGLVKKAHLLLDTMGKPSNPGVELMVRRDATELLTEALAILKKNEDAP